MPLLNEPTPDPDAPPDAEWSEAIGLRNASVRAAWVTLILMILMSVIAWAAPTVIMHVVIRAFVTLILTCILFTAVQNAAQMVGWPITTLAIGACLIVLLSQHVVFALAGVQTRAGFIGGWAWLHPLVLFSVNFTAPIGIIFGWLLCRDGASPWSALLDIFNRSPRG